MYKVKVTVVTHSTTLLSLSLTGLTEPRPRQKPMSLYYGAVCEFCEYHPASFHHYVSVSCSRCLPPTKALKRCATCEAVFYCVCPINGECSIRI